MGVIVYNTHSAEAYQVSVQVHYEQTGHMNMGNGNNGHSNHDIETSETGTADQSG